MTYRHKKNLRKSGTNIQILNKTLENVVITADKQPSGKGIEARPATKIVEVNVNPVVEKKTPEKLKYINTRLLLTKR